MKVNGDGWERGIGWKKRWMKRKCYDDKKAKLVRFMSDVGPDVHLQSRPFFIAFCIFYFLDSNRHTFMLRLDNVI